MKLIVVAALVVAGFYFAYQIVGVLFMLFFAVVLTLVLNAPTMWLVKKKVPRTLAAIIVFFVTMVFLGFVGWLVIPRILEQVSTLVANLPGYIEGMQDNLADALADYPSLQKKVVESTSMKEILPSTRRLITSLSRFSFSLIGGIFMLVFFFSIILYMLIEPRPLLETYLMFFSEENRPKAAEAMARSSRMMVGYMWSNVVVGTIEAVLIFAFLTYMDVPGVWVWAGLALFSEMIPKLGPYVMAAPPVLIALAIDPMTALWVALFYLVMNELMGDFVVPKIRASTMNLHPVSSLFVMLAMAGAFGIVGALIATPLTAFIKAYYEVFYLENKSTRGVNRQIDKILERKVQE